MRIVHTACTDTGLVRQENQDYYRLLPDIGLFILADGMGGARGGSHASKLAADTVADLMNGIAHRDAAALIDSVEQAHYQVRRAAGNDPALNGMGTTIVAALVDDAEVVIVSVGDSRAYRYGRQGLELLTEDQTWVREVGIPLGLDEATLKKHPMRHALTVAVGIDAELEPKYYVTKLEPQAGILLSSDGLHGLVTQERIGAIATDPKLGLEERCKALVSAAYSAGATDNITVVMVEAASNRF